MSVEEVDSPTQHSNLNPTEYLWDEPDKRCNGRAKIPMDTLQYLVSVQGKAVMSAKGRGDSTRISNGISLKLL